MTYIELMNRFWEMDECWQFSCYETRLYFYLLKTANRMGWPATWTRSDLRTASEVGISIKRFKHARRRLVEAGLIGFVPGGNGQGVKTCYSVTEPPAPLCRDLSPSSQTAFVPRGKKTHKRGTTSEPTTTTAPSELLPLHRCRERLESDRDWKERVCKNMRNRYERFDETTLERLLDAFFCRLENEGIAGKTLNDARAHFARWLPIELEREKRSEKKERGMNRLHSTVYDQF